MMDKQAIVIPPVSSQEPLSYSCWKGIKVALACNPTAKRWAYQCCVN